MVLKMRSGDGLEVDVDAAIRVSSCSSGVPILQIGRPRNVERRRQVPCVIARNPLMLAYFLSPQQARGTDETRISALVFPAARTGAGRGGLRPLGPTAAWLSNQRG